MKYIFFSFWFFCGEAFAKLRTFETDYCTNYPEGTRERPELWKHCCLIHDLNFWAGGSRPDRDHADLELRSCIEDTGAVEQARIIYLAVRAGSYSPIKYPKYKWNNGWIGGRAHLSLTSEEIDFVEEELASGYEFIPGVVLKNFIASLRQRETRP